MYSIILWKARAWVAASTIGGRTLKQYAQDKPMKHHLQRVLFPPVTSRMIPICRQAINMVARGEGDKRLEVRMGGYSDILKVTTAAGLVKELRLEEFCEQKSLKLKLNFPSNPEPEKQPVVVDVPVRSGLSSRIAAQKARKPSIINS